MREYAPGISTCQRDCQWPPTAECARHRWDRCARSRNLVPGGKNCQRFLAVTRAAKEVGALPSPAGRAAKTPVDAGMPNHRPPIAEFGCGDPQRECFAERECSAISTFFLAASRLARRSFVESGSKLHLGFGERRDVAAYVDALAAVVAEDLHMQEAAALHLCSLFADETRSRCAGDQL